MSGKAFLNALTALAALGFVVLAVAATSPATGPIAWSTASSEVPHQG
jgi:hypothetical protein